MASKKDQTKQEIKIVPVISEKSYEQANGFNKYTFLVSPETEKIQLAKTIEQKYKVKVVKVNTITKPGKIKVNWQSGRKFRRSDMKKVVVTLKKGDKIDEFFNI